MVRSCSVIVVVAGFALTACATDAPTTVGPPSSQSLKEISPSALKIAPMTPEAPAPKPAASSQPPTNPALAESRTSEEAAQARAADPKDASGANIIKGPVGTDAKR